MNSDLDFGVQGSNFSSGPARRTSVGILPVAATPPRVPKSKVPSAKKKTSIAHPSSVKRKPSTGGSAKRASKAPASSARKGTGEVTYVSDVFTPSPSMAQHTPGSYMRNESSKRRESTPSARRPSLSGGNYSSSGGAGSLERDIEALQDEYFTNNLSPSKSDFYENNVRQPSDSLGELQTPNPRSQPRGQSNISSANYASAIPGGKRRSSKGAVLLKDPSIARTEVDPSKEKRKSSATSGSSASRRASLAAGVLQNAGGTKNGAAVNPEVYNFYYCHNCSNYNYINGPDNVNNDLRYMGKPEGEEEEEEGSEGEDDPFAQHHNDTTILNPVTLQDERNNYFLVSNKDLYSSWTTGPLNPEGAIFDASDRNLFCMDVLNINNYYNRFSAKHKTKVNKQNKNDLMPRPGPLCVVGGADHGLKVFDLYSMRNIKTLYNKNFGHTEWVTCCRCLSDGRIVSGGMDNKVCLWDSFLKNTGNANNLMSLEGEILYDQSSPARCVELLGHSSTISKVEVNAANTLLLSSSYDRSLRLYKIPMFNISAKRKESAVLANAHKSAITHFNWNYNFVLSGDKKGILKIWDLQQAQSTHTFATKKGALTALRAVYMPTAFMNHGEEVEEAGGTPLIAAYGDEVGALTIADVRTRNSQKVFSDIVHPGGSLTEIQFLFNNHYYDTNDQVYHAPDENTGNYSYIPQVVTCGADKKIKILEPRKNFQPLHTFEDHRDFIYSLNVLNHYNRRENRFQNIIFSGDGEGNVLFFDANEGKCLYGLGACTAAVRETAALPGVLACAGDDGKAVVYYY